MKKIKTSRMLSMLMVLMMLFAVVGMAACNGSSDKSTGDSDVSDADSGLPDDNTADDESGADVEAQSNDETASGGASSKKGTSTASGAAGKTSSAPGSNDPYANIPANLKGVTVKLVLGYDPIKRPEGQVIKNFTAKTGIKVDVTVTPWDDQLSKISALIKQGNPPDVIQMNNFPGGTLEITQPIDAAKLDLNDAFWDKSVTKATTFKGKVYGVNSAQGPYLNCNALFYNKSMFEQNGIDTPRKLLEKGTWNWETFTKIASDYSKLGDDSYGVTMTNPALWMMASGADYIKYDGTTFKSNMSDPKIAAAWKFHTQLLKDNLLADGWQIDAFIRGKIGMAVADTFGLQKEGYFKTMVDVVDVVPIPAPKGTTASSPYPFRAFSLCQNPNPKNKEADAKSKQAAGYFLRYFLDPVNYDMDKLFLNNNMKTFYSKINSMPNRIYFMSDGILGLETADGANFIRWPVEKAEPAQVATELAQCVNVVNNAVAKANAKYK